MTWTAADIPKLQGRVAVVTGANSGLGLAISQGLATAGATVVMAVRDLARGEAAAGDIRATVPGADLELRRLDLGSLDSVRTFARDVMAAHPRIDHLFNIAGIMASPPRTTVDGFESQVGTNHLGHFVLTAELLPALGRADGARVVTMTSFGYLTGRPLTEAMTRLSDDYDAWRAYGDAKLANLQFALELARRLEAAGSSVRSLAAHPGLARTALQVTTVQQAGGGPMGRVWQLAARWFGMQPADAALAALRAGTDPRARNGEFYGPRWMVAGAPVRTTPRRGAASPVTAASAWAVSEAVTGTRFGVGPGRRDRDPDGADDRPSPTGP